LFFVFVYSFAGENAPTAYRNAARAVPPDYAVSTPISKDEEKIKKNQEYSD
jgi:hypothetical protein